jgi:hypothetical protein
MLAWLQSKRQANGKCTAAHSVHRVSETFLVQHSTVCDLVRCLRICLVLLPVWLSACRPVSNAVCENGTILPQALLIHLEEDLVSPQLPLVLLWLLVSASVFMKSPDSVL